jgi:hypothetical protein
MRRIGDLIADDEESQSAIIEALLAARILPAEGWLSRVADGHALPGCEAFLALVGEHVLARARDGESGYGLEAEARMAAPSVLAAASDLARGLDRLAAALRRLAGRLARRLEDREKPPDPALRDRLEGILGGLRRRVEQQIEAWSRAAKPNEDAELARDAVLEGSAMAAMVDYLMLGTGRSLKDLPEFDPSMLIGDLGATPTLKTAPPFLKDALIFPYISGLNFSAVVLKNSGWPALSGVFEKPPVSTQQILHPALYKSGKTPTVVSLPSIEKVLGSNWTKLDENILGEFGWREVLKQFLGEERAKSLAAAWDGDRYAVYEHKKTKSLILLTSLHLDSEEHAARFFGQYSEALEKKHAARSNLFRRPNFFSFDTSEGSNFLYCFGEGCITMEGANRSLFDAFTKAMNWPSAPKPPELPAGAPEKTARIFAPAAQGAL